MPGLQRVGAYQQRRFNAIDSIGLSHIPAGGQVIKAQGNNRLQMVVLGASAVLLLTLLGLLGRQWLSGPDARQQAQREAGIVLLSESRALPVVPLRSTADTDFAATALAGRWQLVFFGYTYCPDICPTTLAELRRIHSALPPAVRDRLQVWMVTVDPDRDTREQLRAYLDFFEPSFQGLTGELADIQALSQALSIPFIPGDTGKPGYTVDHSGNLAIIGPDGRQAGFIRAPLQVDALVEQLPLLMD